ncbi:hypothetical protein G5714_012739 [Onychostoma macrolepis]|uniref:BEN domain-containing protein n=1 Tax=Onychostoma macrolepis TaxID=369639 RepID=A0A7J6CHG0_9TELE|nr:hypothetical protein G5714_012739 [Onychostoma macrolepis]
MDSDDYSFHHLDMVIILIGHEENEVLLIQWIEDPPAWDVLPTSKIINGCCEIGGICDVSYKEESSPAKILNIGSRSAMLKQLHSLEKNQSINETRPGENGELGRGHRQKYRRILSESETSEEYESVNKQVAAKNINRIRARSFLQQYQQEKEILKELKEIKSALVEILTILKNGCTPLTTASGSLLTPPGPSSNLLASEFSSVVAAPSSSLLPPHEKETRVNDGKKVKIGPNTSITADQFAHIKWTEPKKATKDLLIAVFGRETISTHCYTGKSSNAFKNKAAKLQLDSLKVSDIISYIKTKFSTEPSVIKKAISEKCADEFKLSKRRHSNCV